VRSAALLLLVFLMCGAPPPRKIVPPPASDRPSARSPIGTNLAPIRDWSTEWSFIDIFKTSRPWISSSRDRFEDGRQLDLDASGWVKKLEAGQIARTLMFWADGLTYPSGDYTVLYEGEGKIEYTPNIKVLESKPQKQIIHVDSTRGGLGLQITETDPKNYIKNIRVLMPEQPSDKPIFHPLFLKNLAPYNTLRFQEWMNVDYDNKQVAWSDRPKLTDARWGDRGVPVEIMVALANRVGADAWFCMPHQASDDWVKQFASYVKEHLDPKLRVYVEYSNEVWNGIFAQAAYARSQGFARRLSGKEDEARLFFQSERSLEMFAIWQSVFPKDRLVRVMAAQAAVPFASELLLSHKDADKEVDVLAIAPYFWIDAKGPMTADDVLDALVKEALPKAAKTIEAQAAVAKKHGVELVAYEGGQHLLGIGPQQDDARLNFVFDRANRDPRMKSIYSAYLSSWRDKGGHLFLHYLSCQGWSKYGRWGAMERQDQPRAEAPKLDALLEFIEKNPRWW
jgi:hypothetical protein